MNMSKTIKLIVSNEMINQALESQDEKDRNTIALWGAKQSSNYEKSKAQYNASMSMRLNSTQRDRSTK